MDWHSPSRSDTCDAHIFSARSQEGKKTWSVDRVWYSRVSVEGRTKEGGRDAEIAGPDDVASKRNGSCPPTNTVVRMLAPNSLIDYRGS